MVIFLEKQDTTYSINMRFQTTFPIEEEIPRNYEFHEANTLFSDTQTDGCNVFPKRKDEKLNKFTSSKL